MRRLLRILLNAATALALLLFMATAAMWVRSFVVADTVRLDRADPPFRLSLETSHGSLRIEKEDVPAGAAPVSWRTEQPRDLVYPTRGEAEYAVSTQSGAVALCAGPFVYSRRHILFGEARTLLLPLWAVAAATGALPGVRSVAWARRRRRPRAGRCPACGYDLRATPDRCPECGKAPTRT